MKILIEGNIGAGKTTLINHLLNFLLENNIINIVNEYQIKDNISDKKVVNLFDSGSLFFKNKTGVNILKELNNDQETWACLVQHNFLLLLDYIQNDYIKDQTNNINIFSRSIYSASNIFTKTLIEENKITKDEESFLSGIYTKLLTRPQIPIDVLIILKCDIDEIIKRLESRDNRKDYTYIKHLQTHYNSIESIIKKEANVKKIYTIDTNKPIDTLNTELGIIFKQIFLKK